MKKVSIAIVFSFLFYLVYSQSCLPEGITFSTQAQIDSFQINYPGCVEIEGDVTITGNNITNLNGLSVLTSVGGYLSIDSCISLTSLTGLENLDSVNSLWIFHNPSLLNLQGFPNHNISLFRLYIVNNDALINLSGLEGVKTVFDLSIEHNDALVSLSGLDSLTTIILWMGWGSQLRIIDNDALINLTGLESLTSFGNSGGGWPTGITIEDNDVLKSLEGINNIEAWTIHHLRIQRNPSLSICDVASICDYLDTPNGTVTIENNAIGCNSPEEVQDSCEAHAGYIDTGFIMGDLYIYPNPASQELNVSVTGYTIDEVMIYTLTGQQVLYARPKGEAINISALRSGMYIVEAVVEGKMVREKLLVE